MLLLKRHMWKSTENQPLKKRPVQVEAISLLHAQWPRAFCSKLLVVPNQYQLLCLRPKSGQNVRFEDFACFLDKDYIEGKLLKFEFYGTAVKFKGSNLLTPGDAACIAEKYEAAPFVVQPIMRFVLITLASRSANMRVSSV